MFASLLGALGVQEQGASSLIQHALGFQTTIDTGTARHYLIPACV